MNVICFSEVAAYYSKTANDAVNCVISGENIPIPMARKPKNKMTPE